MSTVNGFQVGSETLKYNYEALENYNTPNFSASSSEIYAVGDYVMYNGKLYKCTTATTGGTWVSGNWTEAVLSDDVNDIKRQLSDKPDIDLGITGASVGKYARIKTVDANGKPTSWEYGSGGSGGGGGTEDYTELYNKPQINSVTLTGNKTASDLGLGTYSKPSDGIPASDLASGVIPTVPSAYTSTPAMDGIGSDGSSTSWAKGDHVHPSDTSREPATTYTTLSGTAITQTGADHTMYLCGELTELTFTAPETGITAIRFTSGTTPTVVTLTGVTMPDDWEGAEASKVYEINVLNGFGLYTSWEVSGS